MVEPDQVEPDRRLTPRIADFWSRNVNAERLMGRTVSAHPRGSEGYFADLSAQRYRSHRHLLPWIRSMAAGRSVLEIGCGVGLDSFAMARHGLDVTAVDLTRVGVASARERFVREGVAGRFAVCDACRLPFGDGVFDYVYSFGVLHHVADTEASIREVRRVLRPGGEALIMLYNRRSLNEWVHRLLQVPFEERDEACPVVRRYAPAEIPALFAGFSRVEHHVEHLFGEGYGPLYRLLPRPLFAALSRRWGWHIMVRAQR